MNGIATRHRAFGLLLFVTTVAVAGCDDSRTIAGRAAAGDGTPAFVAHPGAYWPTDRLLLEDGAEGDAQVLRMRVDGDRNRFWALGLERVDVYDITTRERIRRVPLPAWSVAELICPPDMAFDRSGNLFISDNAQPKLWRIAADTFHLTDHPIRLAGREHLDIGFGALAFAPDGSLFAIAATGGTLWRIDLESASAHHVELDGFLPEACSLTMR